MSLHEDYEEYSSGDFNYDEEHDDLPHKRRIRRMLEEKLERKRLKNEFKDEFDDEFTDDFNWDELDK